METLSIEAKDCPIESVVVYSDRAQISRTLKNRTINEGRTEIRLVNIRGTIDQNSLRVDGKGNAIIQDVIVAFDVKEIVAPTNEHLDKIKNLKNDLNIVLTRQKLINSQIVAFEKSRNVLDKYSDLIVGQSDKGIDHVKLSSKEIQGQVSGFLKGYVDGRVEIDQQITECNTQLEITNQEIQKLNEKISILESANEPKFHDLHPPTYFKVLIDAEKTETINLTFSYIVVHQAYWKPLYDIRVFSNENQLKVSYHAEINQTTGEDWKDVSVSLSSAKPAISGNAPDFLKSWSVGVYKEPPYIFQRSATLAGKHLPIPTAMSSQRSDPINQLIQRGEAYTMQNLSASSNDMRFVASTVQSDMTSATFIIPSLATIPSDNEVHKVTIALIDLKPIFSYYSCPKLSPSSFLKVKSINESEYAILEGPSSVFLDNNFISKSVLKNISPQEEFECSLGIDESVRISYKPVIKFTEKQGIISKTSVIHHCQNIEIHNTKPIMVNLCLKDQVPKSIEEGVKVVLVEPAGINLDAKGQENSESIASTFGNIISNKVVDGRKMEVGEKEGVLPLEFNCLQWMLSLKPGEKRLVTLKYDIIHAANQSIVFN